MKAHVRNGTRVFNSAPFTMGGELLRAHPLKEFAPPKMLAEANVAHWFARGWHRSARDLSDFVNPAVCDFEV